MTAVGLVRRLVGGGADRKGRRMLELGLALDEPLASVDPTLLDDAHLWAIVLAGGEGRRLMPLTRRLYGDDRPKQYAALIGSRSLLSQTLGRIALLIPPERTVVVTMASHAKYLESELASFADVHVLAQPLDRGTAAAVLLAALWIGAREPQANVVVFPADHFVLDEAAFMDHVADLAAYVRTVPRWLVLLGAPPTAPDADYGWIERGERVGWTPRSLIYRVRRFREKPWPELAHVLFDSGCLWNTLVVAASVAALIDAGRRCVPGVHDPLADGRWTLPQAYFLARTADFSRAVLESRRFPLAVSEMPAVAWCDLGSPERVADVLRSFRDLATRDWR
jgi:mannose-1-phosphate guanylyltransferase